MSDDHAYQAISAYGYRLNNTPNIDRDGKEGHFYQCLRYHSAVCAEPRGLAYRQTQLYQWQDLIMYMHLTGTRITFARNCRKQVTKPR